MKINRDSKQDERQVYRKSQPAHTPPAEPPRRKAYDQEADPAFAEEPLPEFDPEPEDARPARRRRAPVGLIIVLVVLALIAAAGFQVMQLYNEVDGSAPNGEPVTVTVEQGSSVRDIASTLAAAGIIQHDWLFRFYAEYSGRASALQYGDFQLSSGMSYNDLLTALSEQQVYRETVRVTIPEGTTAVGVAQLFVDAGLVDSVETFLACANGEDGSDFSQYEFWNQIPDNEGRLLKCEGYLFPETYEFYTDATVYDIVDTLYAQFDSETADLMDTIAEKGTTLDEVVILASFIQEEAGLPAEDYKVSACFHNRLESNASSYITNDGDNNYLWNSPMAEYMGWPEAGAIPEEVLNAYDTYRISGLPAGAISNPGFAAIDAALNPDEEFMAEGYFFFVTGAPGTDVEGQYLYAKTADEHYQNCVIAGWA